MTLDRYTFDDRANGYFNGHDLIITRIEDHRAITVNRKEGWWSVEVKSDWIYQQRSEAVRTAFDNLSEGVVAGLQEFATDFFWKEADHLTVSRGFDQGCFQSGRSGGWCGIGGTSELWSLAPNDVVKGEEEAVERWIDLCFEIDDLRLTAEYDFDGRILEANQQLQIELSEYADWVGAEVQPLDGGSYPVTKLEVLNGRAALRLGERGFAFAREAKLTRKANGEVPARLTADPIMEQVFQTIEARTNLIKAEIDAFLDADDDHDPLELYVQEIAPAINEIEDRIEQWSHKHLGIQHG